MPHGRKRSYMKKSEETLEDFAISYPLDKLAPLEQVLFLHQVDCIAYNHISHGTFPVLLIYI